MIKTFINEPMMPSTFMESSTSNKGYKILGQLRAPFFDLNAPTRNGRDYSEAADDALADSDFQERFKTRTVFGRLGHPMTEEESIEDPAVRACVILSEYSKNPKTNMYEGTLDILDNQYGRQLKSLIDAGAIMGVSTRGSGDSYESMGGEVIRKGTYDFEALDVVTLPAVKSARVTVVESYDKSKRKKLESLIESSNDKYVLESLKVTLESSDIPNKKSLIESIDNKLSGGVETIESLANNILELTEKLSDSESRLTEVSDELEETRAKLQNGTSLSETIGAGNKVVTEEFLGKLYNLLRNTTNILTKCKFESKNLNDKVGKLYEGLAKANKTNDTIYSELRDAKINNDKLSESVNTLTKKNEELSNSNKELSESLNKYKSLSLSNNDKINSLTESVNSSSKKVKVLESNNKSLSIKYDNLLKKYIESVALAFGVSTKELKDGLSNKVLTPQLIESVAKSIKDKKDNYRVSMDDVLSLGVRKLKENVHNNPHDGELDRTEKLAQLLSNQ